MKNIDLTLMTLDKSFVVIVIIIISMALLLMITGSLQILAFRSPIPQLQRPLLLPSSFLSLPLRLIQQQGIPGVIMPEQSEQQQQPISPPSTPQQVPIIAGVTTNGTINSVIHTPTTNWIATGQWNLGVNNGTLASFTTNMTWYNSNGAAVHTHEFRNFRSIEVGQPITILPDRSLFLRGVTDVGTNNRIVWKNVQSTISIKGGKTILITVNDAQTSHHFAGQPVFGVVSSFTPCSDVPLANMEILPPCMSITTAAAASPSLSLPLSPH